MTEKKFTAETAVADAGTALAEVVPKTDDIALRMIDPVADAKSITVSCQAELDAAVALGKGLAALEKEITETFKDAKTKAHAAHKSVCTLENTFKKPVTEAKLRLRGVVGEYTTRVRLEAEAKARAERERLDAEAEAERQRIEDEKLAQAAELEEKGLNLAAEAVLKAAETVTVPEVPSTVAEPEKGRTAIMSGSSHTRAVYDGKVTNIVEFLAWVLKTERYEMVTVNHAALRKHIKATEANAPIPGVEISETVVPVFR